MTALAALTGLPLLAVLVVCFVALPLLIAAFIAAGAGSDDDDAFPPF